MESTQFEQDTQKLSDSSQEGKDANGNPLPAQVSASDASKQATHTPVLMTSDELDEHVAAGKSVVQSATVPHLQNPTVAAIYQVARPVLLMVKSILFFKPGWAKAIAGLIAVLDVEFPTALN